MFYIQSGSGEFRGYYLMGMIGALPIWTESLSEAWRITLDEAENYEQSLEIHGHLCFVIPA